MISKRKKFLITAAILSLGFIGINLLENQYRFWSIGGLTLLTLILFYWSLAEGLGLDATLLTLILPTLFTLGVGLFWFLLPTTIFARLPIIIFYGLGIYALCLTANIYTVSAIRTIALMRAAKGVGFLLTLIISFLLFDAILSLRVAPWIVTPLVFAAALPLTLQGLWVSNLEKKLSSLKPLLITAGIFSFCLAEIALLLFFWPVTVVVGSLFLTVSFYVILGLGQAQEEERLFPHTIRDYLTVGVVVFLAMVLATFLFNR